MHTKLDLVRLKFHVGLGEFANADLPALVGQFRPYQRINEASFAQFISCLSACYDVIALNSKISKSLALAPWAFCSAAYLYILDPNSQVQRHKKIDVASLQRIRDWYDVTDTLGGRMLRSLEKPICFTRLFTYVADLPEDDRSFYKFVVPIALESLKFDMEDVVEVAKRALVALGHDD